MPAKGQINPAIRDEVGNIIPWKKRNKEVSNASARERRKRNPKKGKLATARYALKHKYGITPELKELLVENQGGVCLICLSTIDATTCATDHCHLHNYIRGMLCRTCNSALGLFKDSPEILRRAAEYLEKSKEILEEPTVEDFEIATTLVDRANERRTQGIALQGNAST